MSEIDDKPPLEEIIITDSSYKFVNEKGDGVFKCIKCAKKFFVTRDLKLKCARSEVVLRKISNAKNDKIKNYCIICESCNSLLSDNDLVANRKLYTKRSYRYVSSSVKEHRKLLQSLDLKIGSLFNLHGYFYTFLCTLLKSNSILALNNQTCQLEKLPLARYIVSIIEDKNLKK